MDAVFIDDVGNCQIRDSLAKATSQKQFSEPEYHQLDQIINELNSLEKEIKIELIGQKNMDALSKEIQDQKKEVVGARDDQLRRAFNNQGDTEFFKDQKFLQTEYEMFRMKDFSTPSGFVEYLKKVVFLFETNTYISYKY